MDEILKSWVEKDDFGSIGFVFKSMVPEHNRIKFALLYGSRQRDVDVVAVYENGALRKQEHIYSSEGFDISMMSEGEFINRTQLFDIEVTEPLTTGTFLYGNSEGSVQSLLDFLDNEKPGESAVAHAGRKSLECLAGAEHYLAQHDYAVKRGAIKNAESLEQAKNFFMDEQCLEVPSKTLVLAMNCLNFSLSYSLCKKHYEKSELVSYGQLLEKSSYLRKFREHLKDFENNIVPPSRQIVKDLYMIMEDRMKKSL